MKNLKVQTRIILGFSSVILIMLGLTGLAYYNLLQIRRETLDLTKNSMVGMQLITKLETASLQDYGHVQAHLLTKNRGSDTMKLSELLAGNSKIDDLQSQYIGTIQDKDDRDAFAELKTAYAKYQTTRQETLRLSQANLSLPAQNQAERDLQTSFNKYFDLLSKLSEINNKMEIASAQDILNAVSASIQAVVIGIILSILLALISCWVLVQAINQPLAKLLGAIDPMRRGDLSKRLTLERNDEFGTLAEGLNLLSDDLTLLIGQVQKASIEVNTSVTEIAATAREQQATASEIAATTTEIGATSKEISATSRELVKSMNDVSNVAEQTASLAVNGQSGLGRMQSTMHQIMDASGSINSRLAILNEKAGNINTVVTTIAKVADQTNLLSLNAAIEAEKAGEYGRGFAVVATEIRRLADQTAVATLDIEQMVKEMQSAVSAGVMGMDKFSEEVRRGVEVAGQVNEQLTQIIEHVQTLTPNFEVVNEGMQSQSVGAQQISDALGQLSEAAQQTVESLYQSNLAIEQMNETVRDLQSGISRFTLTS